MGLMILTYFGRNREEPGWRLWNSCCGSNSAALAPTGEIFILTPLAKQQMDRRVHTVPCVCVCVNHHQEWKHPVMSVRHQPHHRNHTARKCLGGRCGCKLWEGKCATGSAAVGTPHGTSSPGTVGNRWRGVRTPARLFGCAPSGKEEVVASLSLVACVRDFPTPVGIWSYATCH